MPDTKITALTAITTVDPAVDVLPIVDVSDTTMAASGTTKKITSNQILGAGGTAALASATITGDLTVKTNVLKVDSVNERFGFRTASPAYDFDINGVVNLKDAVIHRIGGNPMFARVGAANSYLYVGTTGLIIRNNADSATFATFDGSGNVGIGVTPSARLDLLVADAAEGARFRAASGWLRAHPYLSATDGARWQAVNGTNTGLINLTLEGFNLRFNTNGGLAATLDASGNLLVGTAAAAGVRLDVQTASGNCIGRLKSNAAASTASFIIDYVETLGCTYIKKAGSDVWIYGVQNDTSATPSFKINTASNVGVQLVSGATAWTTLSDETMKDIIEPINNAVAKVGSLRSVIGKFKTDDSSKRRSFLIAQDVQSVLPEAVDVVGENNELGLRYTEVIPLLVAAIKELTAEVNALKNA